MSSSMPINQTFHLISMPRISFNAIHILMPIKVGMLKFRKYMLKIVKLPQLVESRDNRNEQNTNSK